ncbi:elongation factor G-like protein [Leptospira wolffii]|uniref:elongation factor G-like protein n=1 Tax=Leptospira wolffii TaxID=409998 RepID=UPI0010848367|nr:elongation factor G-like protein [Leptospira wolffii]TGK62467.1 elongation factor G-like protein [Leptospira wolffii]TGK66010.1 elongation factor G-like protein [Leptospira wolffii]TGK74148.1 elongation factor G-like protein [Leptospira wolffii]TGL29007.1 elongation factor G-like protein [Leptospira wolffii]
MSLPFLNPGIFAHIDAGKTTLLERILFETGKISSPGRIEEGTTESDYLPEEIERGISIQSTVARIPYPNEESPRLLLQFVDNPGHLDFQSQANASLLVSDFGLVLVDSFEGLKSQTFQNVEALRKAGRPILLFLNKLDREGSDILTPLVDLEVALGKEPVLLFKEEGEVPLLEGKGEERDLLPCIEWDPDLSEEYLKDHSKLPLLAKEGLIKGFWEGKVFPVLGGSALHGQGIPELLSILELLAKGKPAFRPPISDAWGVVFKREVHPELGKLVHFQAWNRLGTKTKVFSETGDISVGNLYRISARDFEVAEEVEPGELVATSSLLFAKPGDILLRHNTTKTSLLSPIKKQFQILLEPEKGEDREELWNSLQELAWLDESIGLDILPETGQFRLSGTGELHLEISLSRLRSIFSKSFQTSGIKVARFALWKNLVQKVAFQHTAFDQKISSGQVLASLESSHSFSKGVRFNAELSDSIEEAISSAFEEVTAKGKDGEEVLGLSMIVESYEPPETESSFDLASLIKVAVIKGLKDIIPNHSELIGPVSELEILTPDSYLGDILASLSKRDAKIRKVVAVADGRQLIQASASTQNLLGFSGVLRNMAQGRGVLSLDTLFDFDNHSVLF